MSPCWAELRRWKVEGGVVVGSRKEEDDESEVRRLITQDLNHPNLVPQVVNVPG